MQFVIAGKSHPADDEGKRLIQQLVQFAQQPELRERIVFLPDYDMGMAEMLYPGCDVWLNNPLRPLEACGTSGMKAAMNGALNLSILDGWWAEYAGDDYGWVIPSADAAGDAGERDALEAAALYELLEHRVATRYYERDGDGVPVEWVRRVRQTLATLAPELGADRMVKQYVEELYRPAAEHAARVVADDDARRARARGVRRPRARVRGRSVQVAHVESGGVEAPHVGDELHLRAYVELDGLAPDDVAVEVVYGRSRADETIETRAPDGARARCDDGADAVAARARGCTRARSCSTARARSATRCASCRGIRCSLSPAELGLVAVAGSRSRRRDARDAPRRCSDARRVGSAVSGRGRSARSAPPVTASRSSGASSRSRPRRPPETKIVSQRIADSSSTVGSARLLPDRADAADDVARLALGDGRVGHLGALAAEGRARAP